MVDLRTLSGGGNFGLPTNQGAIVYQAGDPNGGFGCNDNCSLPPTPAFVGVKPGLTPTTCKNIFLITKTGSTGVTGTSIIRGLGQNGAASFALYASEISCGDDVDFDLFPSVTNVTPTVDVAEGILHLMKFNQINTTTPEIINNIVVRVAGLDEAAVQAQLQANITVISLDVNSNGSVCMVQLSPADCSICVNPTASGTNLATFTPNCPLFIDDTHGYFYPILPGTSSVKLTECVMASAVVKNYTQCGTY